jgi:hypothetical protein
MKAFLIPVLTVALLAFVPAGEVAANPQALDRLLQEVREHRQREAQRNREREQRFLAERNQQQRLLAEARAELQRQNQPPQTACPYYFRYEVRTSLT